MKNRRIIVAAILVLAIACVGVGYAAMTTSIQGTGTINYNPDLVLNWTGNVAGDADVTTNTTDGTTLAFSIDADDWTKDVTHTYTATVTNTSTKYTATGVTVTLDSNDAAPEFDVVTTISGDGSIAPGATATVTIKITLKQYPVEEPFKENFVFTVSNTGVTSA